MLSASEIVRIMCGRFEIHSTLDTIAAVFNLDTKDLTIIKPNYNVVPTHDVFTVRQNGKRQLVQCRWCFIPSWAQEEKIAYKMINARAVAEKPSIKKAFLDQRCLIVADGFYEWKKAGRPVSEG